MSESIDELGNNIVKMLLSKDRKTIELGQDLLLDNSNKSIELRELADFYFLRFKGVDMLTLKILFNNKYVKILLNNGLKTSDIYLSPESIKDIMNWNLL